MNSATLRAAERCTGMPRGPVIGKAHKSEKLSFHFWSREGCDPYGMVLGAPSFVATQWTMYWQGGCDWVSVTVASNPWTLNCPVMVTLKPETEVGLVEKCAVLSIVPVALMLTCVMDRVWAPGL